MIRPARLALLLDNPTVGDVCSAARAAVTAWGGVYWPIVDLARRSGHVDLFEWLSVDALWPFAQSDRARQMAALSGFQWQAFGPYGPYDPPEPDGILNMRSAEMTTLTDPEGGIMVLPAWSPDDPFEALLSIWFGEFESSTYGCELRDLYARHACEMDVMRSTSTVDEQAIFWRTPAKASGSYVEYTGEPLSCGIVIVDPDEPADLLRFWNLRAGGADIVPWVVGAEDRLEAVLRMWLFDRKASGRLIAWAEGQLISGEPPVARASVWPLGLDELIPDRLRGIFQDEGVGWMPGCWFPSGWRNTHPCMTYFRRSFSVDHDPKATSIEIPLPTLPLRHERQRDRYPGLVAADVTVQRDEDGDPARTVCLPRIRHLAGLMPTETFGRPNGRGGVYGIQADSESVKIGIAHPIDVFEKLFNRPDWTCDQSDDGHFTTMLAQRLGTLASQPAVREVLTKAVGAAETGAPFNALTQCAKKSRGTWPEAMLPPIEPEEYARRVVRKLADQDLLRAVQPIVCPVCRNEFGLEPGNLADNITCDFCGHQFPLALFIAWRGQMTWQFRIAGHVNEKKLKAALPAAATGRVVDALRANLIQPGMTVFGLKLLQDSKEYAEFDIASVIDTVHPTIVIGEVKNHVQLSQNTLNHLEEAQLQLHTQGIRCFLLFATMWEGLNDSEGDLLRDYCRRVQVAQASSGDQSALHWPIVLTNDDLSVDVLSEKHPSMWIRVTPTLEDIAEESCKRNLGLDSSGIRER